MHAGEFSLGNQGLGDKARRCRFPDKRNSVNRDRNVGGVGDEFNVHGNHAVGDLAHRHAQNEFGGVNGSHANAHVPSRAVKLRRTRGRDPAVSLVIKGPRVAEKIGVVIPAAGKGQSHGHPDVIHHAHGRCHGGYSEVPQNEVAVGHPGSISPAKFRGGGVRIHISRADIGDGRKDHGVETEPIHPLLKIEVACFLQTSDTLRQIGNLLEGRDAVALGPVNVLLQRHIFGSKPVQVVVVTTGQ